MELTPQDYLEKYKSTASGTQLLVQFFSASFLPLISTRSLHQLGIFIIQSFYYIWILSIFLNGIELVLSFFSIFLPVIPLNSIT